MPSRLAQVKVAKELVAEVLSDFDRSSVRALEEEIPPKPDQRGFVVGRRGATIVRLQVRAAANATIRPTVSQSHHRHCACHYTCRRRAVHG